MKWLFFALAGATYGSHIWGAMFYFRASDSAARRGKLVISVLGGASTLIAFVALARTPAVPLVGALVGGSLWLASLGLFWWSIRAQIRPLAFAFSTAQTEVLVVHGPYRWLRHPFYAAYIAGWLAPLVAVPQTSTAAVAFLMTGLYCIAAWHEERGLGMSSLARSYETYCARTGMFWPRLRRPGGQKRGPVERSSADLATKKGSG